MMPPYEIKKEWEKFLRAYQAIHDFEPKGENIRHNSDRFSSR